MLTQSHRNVPKLGACSPEMHKREQRQGTFRQGHTDSHTQAWMRAHVPKLQGTETP